MNTLLLMEGQKTKHTIEFAVTRNLLQKREYYLSTFQKETKGLVMRLIKE